MPACHAESIVSASVLAKYIYTTDPGDNVLGIPHTLASLYAAPYANRTSSDAAALKYN